MSYPQLPSDRFALGRILATPSVLAQISPDEIGVALTRHLNGDWGDVCPDDWRANDVSLISGYRLLSVYRSDAGTKFWVITEADRSATTVLLPEDY